MQRANLSDACFASSERRGRFKLDERGVYAAVPLEDSLNTELRRYQLDYQEKEEL